MNSPPWNPFENSKDDRSYWCPFCQKPFTRRDVLQRHMKRTSCRLALRTASPDIVAFVLPNRGRKSASSFRNGSDPDLCTAVSRASGNHTAPRRTASTSALLNSLPSAAQIIPVVEPTSFRPHPPLPKRRSFDGPWPSVMSDETIVTISSAQS
ncbi:hypothetical protein M427DRAFT_362714 [Gonapodya prolifera JEL478]|uniref:C2H2-type domain-containing protein n=1 Tax=Gonapodya prolifera (strain JEL478) TaxID=1344416 RepID=A0A139AAN8_GONPJ|nr:hypothetical protein M427DRAFT_362714 [Gonapodya prolifera JEL478]|eukprot:KXS13719.1 hypothetical protein M427DRAFT_362714 [Gonapodya prolifera JEL478]